MTNVNVLSENELTLDRPDNSGGDEFCVHDEGGWNDLKCNSAQVDAYVCKTPLQYKKSATIYEN